VKLRWRIAWHALYPWAKLLIPLRVTGRELLLSQGPQILAANHTANVDPILVGLAAGREIHFLAKEELFNYRRWFTWLIRTWNAWPVRRRGGDPQAIRKCAWLLQHRQSLVLFPEGTRSRTGELQRFRPGIGLLAIQNRAPVVPTLISGINRSMLSFLTDRDFARHGHRRRPENPARVRVTFGAPVRPDGFENTRAGHVALTAAVEERMRALARPAG
jgi:1-acyl-sn-glycerol-3-phosphate acyltransferase